MKHPISRYTLAIFLVTAIALSVGNDAKAAQTAGSFVPTFGTMMTPREDHAAALLQNDLVLIAGGETAVPCCTGNTGEGPPLSSAELFNPSTGMFSPTGSMTTGRIFPIAVTLPNG